MLSSSNFNCAMLKTNIAARIALYAHVCNIMINSPVVIYYVQNVTKYWLQSRQIVNIRYDVYKVYIEIYNNIYLHYIYLPNL